MKDYSQIFQDARDVFQSELEKVASRKQKPTILVCGYTGSGKTTLIQSILGKKSVPDEQIKHGQVGTMGFTEYKDDFITLLDSRGLEPNTGEAEFTKTIDAFIRQRQSSDNIDDHIHLIWYCIQGVGARVTDTDIKLIKEIFPSRTLEVVITKADVTRENQKTAIIDELKKRDVRVNNITFVSDLKDDAGIKELVKKSVDILPVAYREAFISKQQVQLEYKKAIAEKLINETAINTGWWGLIPLIDLIVILPKQVRMIANLTSIYGFDSSLSNQIVGPTMLATLAATLTSSTLMDSIPALGAVLSAFGVAAITKGVGQITCEYLHDSCLHIINGGDVQTIQPLNMSKLAEYVKKYL